MQNSKTLGVLGGLGPMATVHFYEMVTTMTQADADQDHLDIIISSKASTPDRSAYILDGERPNPFPVMLHEATQLVAYGAQLLAIPCNTAHYFYDDLRARVDVPVLNMVGDTVQYVRQLGVQKVGVLATDGTVFSRTYQLECERQGLDCAVPSAGAQQGVMRVIYDIKAGRTPDAELFGKAAAQLKDAGCGAVILGCTELSLVKKHAHLGSEYVDSMEVLAKAAILACGKQLKK